MNESWGGQGHPSSSSSSADAANGELIGRQLAKIARTFRATSIGALFILIAWLLRDILLLIFASVLMACVLGGLADLLHRHSKFNRSWSLTLVVAALTGLLAGLVWWRGAEMINQMQQLTDQLIPQAQSLWSDLGRSAWGRRVAESLRHFGQSATDSLPRFATGVVTSTLGTGGSLVVVTVTGLCLAASPEIHVAGTLRLLPPDWRVRGREVLGRLGQTLRLWFLGQVIDVVVVTLLVGTGLVVLDVPLAAPLAMFAGLLNVVPYIGALVGSVPALLVALSQSPTLALWVALLFLTVQMIEGNVIAPLVQKHTGTLPPALTIMSQTVLGTLFGPLGLVLAAPVMAASLTAVRMIYVESVLEHDAQVRAEIEPHSISDKKLNPR